MDLTLKIGKDGGEKPGMSETFDLVIVGGGINGCALARLAAFNGLQVALFELGDLGQGSSSASSKLIHGGVRYLEQFRLGLVRESVRERADLRETAPHLVEESRFLFPITKKGRHLRLAIKAGMLLYDGLAGGLRLGKHAWVNAEKLKQKEPLFLPNEKCGAYEYSDCTMDDSRLVLENALDAKQLGAQIFTYHEFVGVEEDLSAKDRDNSELEVSVRNRITGTDRVVRTKRLAFTSGAWTNSLVRAEFKDAKDQVRLSQGSHWFVSGLPIQASFILPVPRSNRYFFVFPWKENHLVGTTEVDLGSQLPDKIIPRETELQELKQLLADFFPSAKPHWICNFAGLRPLAYSKGKSNSKKSNNNSDSRSLNTAKLSREHEFHKLHRAVFSVVGGKYTTHRPMAEQFLHFILGKAIPFNTLQGRLFPGAWKSMEHRSQLKKEISELGVTDSQLIEVWLKRYGVRALDLARLVLSETEFQQVIDSEHHVVAGEIVFSAKEEWTRYSIDFLRRRSSLFFTVEGGKKCSSLVADWLAKINGHSANASGGPDYHKFLEDHNHVTVT